MNGLEELIDEIISHENSGNNENFMTVIREYSNFRAENKHTKISSRTNETISIPERVTSMYVNPEYLSALPQHSVPPIPKPKPIPPPRTDSLALDPVIVSRTGSKNSVSSVRSSASTGSMPGSLSISDSATMRRAQAYQEWASQNSWLKVNK
jgi:hypothetical protein